MVKRAGGALIEVNPYETALTDWCDAVLRGPSGEALPALVARIRELKGLGSRP
jgi:NAD-dependent SIR2 family protein deacetylase